MGLFQTRSANRNQDPRKCSSQNHVGITPLLDRLLLKLDNLKRRAKGSTPVLVAANLGVYAMTDTIETRRLSPLELVSPPFDRNTGQPIGF
jgi:hypothetical protein